MALIIGAITNTTLSAAAGIKSSFSASFTPSAKAWIRPNFPTRFGPTRICMRATMRRSPQTDMIVNTTQTAKTITALRVMIQPGSSSNNWAFFMPSPPLLHRRAQHLVKLGFVYRMNYVAPKLHHHEYLQQVLAMRSNRVHLLRAKCRHL